MRRSPRSHRREPQALALIHFGVATDVADHLERLSAELDRWAELVRSGLDSEQFRAEARAGAGQDVDVYELSGPFDQSWLGLRRYWVKRGELTAD